MVYIPSVIYDYKNKDIIIPCKPTSMYFRADLFEEDGKTAVSKEFFEYEIGYLLKNIQSNRVFYCQCGAIRKRIIIEIKNSGKLILFAT